MWCVGIMQLNCDHLSSRIPELEEWLRKNDVDVTVVQDSRSAPNVTFRSPGGFESLQWRVVRELGSDHFIILIRVMKEGRSKEKGKLFWDWSWAKWDDYQAHVQREVEAVSWEGNCGRDGAVFPGDCVKDYSR